MGVPWDYVAESWGWRVCQLGQIWEWLSHKDASLLKHYKTKNNTQAGQALQAAFGDASCQKCIFHITPHPAT